MVENRVNGSFSLPKIWDADSGQWEKFEGHQGHSGLITIHTALTSAVATLFTVTSGKKGYITFLHVAATATGIKEYAFKTTGTAGSTYITGCLATRGKTGDKITLGNGKDPIMELAEGVFRGNMQTGAAHFATLSYYEV